MSEEQLNAAIRQFNENSNLETGLAVFKNYCRLDQQPAALQWLAEQQLTLQEKLTVLDSNQIQSNITTAISADNESSQLIFIAEGSEANHILASFALEGAYWKAIRYRNYVCVIAKYKQKLMTWALDDIGGVNHFAIEKEDREIHSVTVIDNCLLVGGAEGGGWDEVAVQFTDKSSWFAFLNESEEWQTFDGLDQFPARKAIDCVTRYGSQMLAWDNMILPKYVIEYDIEKGPTQAQFKRTIELPMHGANEHIKYAAHFADYAIYLSTTARRMGSMAYVNVVDTKDFKQHCKLQIALYPAHELQNIQGFKCQAHSSLVFGPQRAFLFPWRHAVDNSIESSSADSCYRIDLLEQAQQQGFIESTESYQIQDMDFVNPDKTDSSLIWCLIGGANMKLLLGRLVQQKAESAGLLNKVKQLFSAEQPATMYFQILSQVQLN